MFARIDEIPSMIFKILRILSIQNHKELQREITSTVLAPSP